MDNNEAEVLAASLRKITAKMLKKPRPGHELLWYRGQEPYFDVFFELLTEEKQLTWFQFTLRGRVVTWDRTRLFTGTTSELTPQQGYPGATEINEDRTPDLELVDDVLRILNVRGLDAVFAQARERLVSFAKPNPAPPG